MTNVLRVFFVAALFVTLSPSALAQSERSALPPGQAVEKAAPQVDVLSARGGAMVFTDRPSFEAECGMLPTEDYNEGNVPDNDFDVVQGPIDNSTTAVSTIDGTVVFEAGDILPGLTVTAIDPTTGADGELFVSGSGFDGASSIEVGNNSSAEDLTLGFDPAVDCAGGFFDPLADGATDVSALDASGNVLGTATVTTEGFVGFRASPQIASIVAFSSVSAEFVDSDDISFGDVGGGPDPITIEASPDAQSVPQGGTASFDYTVENNTAMAQSGVVFYEVFTSGGNQVVGPVEVQSGTLPAGQSVTAGFSVNVPNNAPTMTYSVEISAGPSNGNAVATDIVAVTVTPAPRVAGSAATWSLAEAEAWEALEAAARTSEVGAYPNPFARTTEIGFELDKASDVSLVVYDVRGREVVTLADGPMEAGAHRVSFDAQSLPSGVYVYRLVSGAQVETGRITLIQ